MYTRGFGLGAVVLMSVLGAASCGGDDGGEGATQMSCIPMSQSTPNTAADPCPQNAPQCPAPMYVAVSTCMPTGTWNTQCQCVLASTLGMQGNGISGGSCGNGMIEAAKGEQCEPSLPVGTDCATLRMGPGTVTCNPTTCMYQMTCTAPPSNTGGDGA